MATYSPGLRYQDDIIVESRGRPQDGTPMAHIVPAVAAGRYELLLPLDLIGESRHLVQSRKRLAARMSAGDLPELLDMLSLSAVVVPEIAGGIPALTRDPQDDYLLACAVVGVKGDDDLPVRKVVEGVSMVTAQEFWEGLVLWTRQGLIQRGR